jgi:hypothetical protein
MKQRPLERGWWEVLELRAVHKAEGWNWGETLFIIITNYSDSP